jgi:hypothetical protein
VSTPQFFSNVILEFLVRTIKWKKEIKEIQLSKEENKLPQFEDYVILNLKTLQKLLHLISMFSKIAGQNQYKHH